MYRRAHDRQQYRGVQSLPAANLRYLSRERDPQMSVASPFSHFKGVPDSTQYHCLGRHVARHFVLA